MKEGRGCLQELIENIFSVLLSILDTTYLESISCSTFSKDHTR